MSDHTPQLPLFTTAPYNPNEEIPYGYCQCGCGQKTPLATRNRPEHGLIKGQPRHFLRGHKIRNNTPEQGFQKHEISGDPAECWIWPGVILQTGYGVGICLGKPYLAHRVSYIVHNGPIPDGMFVCHKCDNPACVNPNHLFLGTPADNSRDMAAKGRSPRGQHHPNAKITNSQAREIYKLAKTELTAREIAEIMNVSIHIVYRIRQKRTWKHVP